MKLSEKIQEALREQQEINLSDPAVQKRLAAQWGYVPAEAQPAPSQEDESVRKSWARFSNELHRSHDAPCPGMADAFEQHFSQSFIDREWRAEAATWAAAWKAAKRHCAQPAPSVPDGFAWPECPNRRQSHVLFDDGYEEGWAACVATIKAALAAPEAKP